MKTPPADGQNVYGMYLRSCLVFVYHKHKNFEIDMESSGKQLTQAQYKLQGQLWETHILTIFNKISDFRRP